MEVVHTLAKNEARLITMFALIDQLLIDAEKRVEYKSRAHNAILAMQDKLKVADGAFKGKVPDEFVVYADRYLCKTQIALDTFWNEVTEQDLLDMKEIKEIYAGRSDSVQTEG